MSSVSSPIKSSLVASPSETQVFKTEENKFQEPHRKRPNIGSGVNSAFNEDFNNIVRAETRPEDEEEETKSMHEPPSLTISKPTPIIIPSPRSNAPISTLMFDIKTPRPHGTFTGPNPSFSSPFQTSAFGKQDSSSKKAQSSSQSPKKRMSPDGNVVRPIPISVPSTPMFLQNLDNSFFNSSISGPLSIKSQPGSVTVIRPEPISLRFTPHSPKRNRDGSDFTPSAFLATPLRDKVATDTSTNFEPLPPVGEQVMDIYSRYDYFQKQNNVGKQVKNQQISVKLERRPSVDSHGSRSSSVAGSSTERKGRPGGTETDLAVLAEASSMVADKGPRPYGDKPLPVLIVNSNLAEASSASIVPLKTEYSTGSSCHQCKNRRDKQYLSYCCNAERRHRIRSRKNCRKKYCDQCLLKFYDEKPPTIRYLEAGCYWECPACRDMCSCAACNKKRKGGVDDGNDST